MNSHDSLDAQFIDQLARGDEAAIRQFVAFYEPFIRRAIRPRINRYRLGAIVDSADLCQSVMGGFLVRVTCGKFELTSVESLQRLLMAMLRKKFAHLVRREYAQRRDRNRVIALSTLHEPADRSALAPDQQVIRHDLVEQIRSRLTEMERDLFLRRLSGESWETIGQALGQTAIQLRKRLSRGLRRVVEELGLN